MSALLVNTVALKSLAMHLLIDVMKATINVQKSVISWIA
jgi:hypothetical protein